LKPLHCYYKTPIRILQNLKPGFGPAAAQGVKLQDYQPFGGERAFPEVFFLSYTRSLYSFAVSKKPDV
jgi:hypothetical protein